ncbi:AAA family ATPase [Streptomyces sp. NPDC058603]|uniref:AAA family ATPase n=1 Tax=Streptomyces sp. NPDC058603 TaxID=3346551 RepID=UPI003667B97A
MVTTPQPIRIGIMGTHSTGKTTLLKRIEMELRAHGTPVARTGRLGKRAALTGLPKMQHHTAASTEWIITQGIADEIAATAHLNSEPIQVVLADRAAWDALAYFHAAEEWSQEPPTLWNENDYASWPTPRRRSTTCCSPRSSTRPCPSNANTTTTPATGRWSTTTPTPSSPNMKSHTNASPATPTAKPVPSKDALQLCLNQATP